MNYTVMYEATNSGGSDWLNDADWQRLVQDGWRLVEYKSAVLAVEAESQHEAKELAVARWQAALDKEADVEGCECCGPPHSFFSLPESEWFDIERGEEYE